MILTSLPNTHTYPLHINNSWNTPLSARFRLTRKTFVRLHTLVCWGGSYKIVMCFLFLRLEKRQDVWKNTRQWQAEGGNNNFQRFAYIRQKSKALHIVCLHSPSEQCIFWMRFILFLQFFLASSFLSIHYFLVFGLLCLLSFYLFFIHFLCSQLLVPFEKKSILMFSSLSVVNFWHPKRTCRTFKRQAKKNVVRFFPQNM